MAGVKGRSGGARPGAGRPRKQPAPLAVGTPPDVLDPKAFLLALMASPDADIKLRIEAAKAVLPYVHAKLGEQGKKEERASAAKVAAKGKFAPKPPPPRLVVNNQQPGDLK